MKNRMRFFQFFLILAILFQNVLFADEVLTGVPVKIVKKEHPRTGKKFYSVVSEDIQKTGIAAVEKKNYSRPDYRFLDHTVKSGTIPYDGPSSSRKKVYVLAGTVATLGVVGGSVGMMAAASAPVSAGTGSGAVGYLAAGTAVGTGSLSTAWLKSRPDPERDNFERTSGTRVIQVPENFKPQSEEKQEKV